MNYRAIITIEPGKRGGRPCIRGMRTSGYDILGRSAAGMTNEQIIEEFPGLTLEDIRASLAYAADRDHHLVGSVARSFSSTRTSATACPACSRTSFRAQPTFVGLLSIKRPTTRFGTSPKRGVSALSHKTAISLNAAASTTHHPKWSGCDAAMPLPSRSR